MSISPDTIRERVWAQRLLAENFFDRLAEGSVANPGVTRDPYGPGEHAAHALVAAVARERGLEVSADAAANTYLTLRGRDRSAPKLLIGSHLDSVAHDGNFDG